MKIRKTFCNGIAKTSRLAGFLSFHCPEFTPAQLRGFTRFARPALGRRVKLFPLRTVKGRV
jgi:hypothetical protein